MSGVEFPEDAVTVMDIREKMGDVIDEIEAFVSENVEEDVWEYREFELFQGITLVCDWSVEDLRETYVVVDTEAVGDWYVQPDEHDITEERHERRWFDEDEGDAAWGMAMFRGDATMKTTPRQGGDRYMVQIDHSGRTAPRGLTRSIECLEEIDYIPQTYEYSPKNSGNGFDTWV